MAYLPGVTGDGQTPPGIGVEGHVRSSAVQAKLVSAIDLDQDIGSASLQPHSLSIIRVNDNDLPIVVRLSAGSSGQELVLLDSTSAPMWQVDADGTEHLAGGFGRFGTAPPVAASVIAGALSAVTDAAAKDVLTSIIAALIADGGATNGTT